MSEADGDRGSGRGRGRVFSAFARMQSHASTLSNDTYGALRALPASTQHAIQQGLLTSVTSGIVVGLMLFVFCCVFSEMIFGQNDLLKTAVPLGVGTQTMTAMIGALAFARFSGSKAVIAGPDINPVVFLAEAARSISDTICPDALDGSCELAHRAVPTVMVSMLVATSLVGASFWLLGRLRMTVIIGFIPSHVVAGFLSCIGYKVLKASIEVACPVGKKVKLDYLSYFFGSWRESWMFMLPALPIGIPLYLLKRLHIGKPTVNFPLFIIGPAVIFYAALFASGHSLDDARRIGWLFEEANQNSFWTQWSELYGGIAAGDVHWAALPACLPTWLVMLLIVNLDNMLKLASTESALGVDFEYNHEMIVGGASTLAAAFLGGSPAYSQTKFNVLNYAMTHSTASSLPAVVVGVFCGALFFSGAPLINYLPRFLLSGLLVFSAVGFLVENLWDSRTKFQRLNFAAIWAVFIINVVMGEVNPQFGLLIAIVSGMVWGLFSFAVHFARKSVTTEQISGELHCSTAIRSAAQEAKLGVLGVWYTIFSAQGYIFFGTAAKLHRMFKAHVAEMSKKPRAERTKYLILDMSKVNGMDETAGVVFAKVDRLGKQVGVALVWAGAAQSVAKRLERIGLLGEGARRFATLDVAEKWVEDTLLRHVHALSLKWLVDKTCRQVYTRAMLHDALTSASSAGGMGPSQLLRWCNPQAGDDAAARTMVAKGDQILREGGEDDGLYLLYRGLINVSEGGTSHTIYPGAFFNEHVLYSASDAGALYTASAEEDSIILRISGRQREQMQEQNPHDSYQLLLSVFRQIEMRNPVRRHHTWVEEDEPDASGKARPSLRRDANYAKLSTGGSQRLSIGSPPRHAAGGGGSGRAEDTFALPPSVPGALAGAATAKERWQAAAAATVAPAGFAPGARRGSRRESMNLGTSLATRDTNMRSILTRALTHGSQLLADAPAAAPERPERQRSNSPHASFAPPRSRERTETDQTNATNATGASAGGHDKHHATHDHHHRVTEVLDAEFIHGDDFKTPLTPAQEEHFKLIFSLNDHNGDGSIKVAELAQFMGSLGHGLPSEQLEELIKDMGMDEDVDRTIFRDDFLSHVCDSGRTWRNIFREDFMELLRREGHSSRTIFLSTFLEFMRRALVADLPSSKLEQIHSLFRRDAQADTRHSAFPRGAAPAPAPPLAAAAAALLPAPTEVSAGGDAAGGFLEVGARQRTASPFAAAASSASSRSASPERKRRPSHVVEEYPHLQSPEPLTCGHAQVEAILQRLGFHLDDVTFHELFDEVDGDGDGHIFEREFVTMLGMLKRNLLEVMLLEQSFTRFRAARDLPSPGAEKRDEHLVYASDLVATLGVTELEAEEMIFIADLKDNQSIDFTEFKQVVVQWSA